INNKGFHFSFLLHLSIPYWCELYSGRVKNGAYCRKQRRDLRSRQCSTKQLDLKPAEGGRAVLSGPAALCRNERYDRHQQCRTCPSKSCLKVCNSASLTSETAQKLKSKSSPFSLPIRVISHLVTDPSR